MTLDDENTPGDGGADGRGAAEAAGRSDWSGVGSVSAGGTCGPPPWSGGNGTVTVEAGCAGAGRVSSNPDAYVYLAESIRSWPPQAQLARIIADAGWRDVRFRNLTGGIVALHLAQRD